MKNAIATVFPTFRAVKVLKKNDLDKESCFHRVCKMEKQKKYAYLLDTSASLADFLNAFGKAVGKGEFDLFAFYVAYNIKFPPNTVVLMEGQNVFADNIRDFAQLLNAILTYDVQDDSFSIYIVILDTEAKKGIGTRLYRDILQQFIYLRMMLPILKVHNERMAGQVLERYWQNRNSDSCHVTIFGARNSGKSTLVNALLGAEYIPASPELPTPNVVTYSWAAKKQEEVHLSRRGVRAQCFADARALRDYLEEQYREADCNLSDMYKMSVHAPAFPAKLHGICITDTPSMNFAVANDHERFIQEALKHTDQCVFVINYNNHLSNDEVALFQKVYEDMNKKTQNCPMIVAVNQIDGVYNDESEIPSYERITDYIKRRLNALGYDNILVISIVALLSVYAGRAIQLLPKKKMSLKTLLNQLHLKDKVAHLFLGNMLNNMNEIQGASIMQTDELRDASRIWYLTELLRHQKCAYRRRRKTCRKKGRGSKNSG